LPAARRQQHKGKSFGSKTAGKKRKKGTTLGWPRQRHGTRSQGGGQKKKNREEKKTLLKGSDPAPPISCMIPPQTTKKRGRKNGRTKIQHPNRENNPSGRFGVGLNEWNSKKELRV